MIENSVKGENWMFRNFYIEKDGVVMDSLDDGQKSCAVLVSGILVFFNDLFHWIKAPHANVVSTEKDMEENGWYEVKDLRPGAVVIWEKKDGRNGMPHNHIGFYMGDNKAISNDSRGTGFPHKHHYTYNDTRKIEKIYWHPALDEE